MKETEKIREQDIAQVKVTLKPIFGMRPRVYVPILYVLALLVVLFFVLVNPGLRKPGAHLVFDGNPESAAVYLDGSYAGNTLDGFYAKPGPHELEIRKRGFSSQTFKVEVPRRIFATLIFRPRVKLAYELSPESLEAIMVPSFKEFANWSFSGKPSAIYQLPMVLSEAAADAASTPFSDRSALAVPLLAAGLSVAENASSTRDVVYASAALAAPGGSPLGLIALARSAASLLGSSKNYAAAAMEIIPEKATDTTRASLAALKQEASAQRISQVPSFGTRSVGPHSFIMFAGGALKTVSSTPGGTRIFSPVEVPEFGLAATEVTGRQFARFLEENPEWKPENRTALIEKGLADASYLADFDPSKADDRPVTGVSWHAAKAYCAWLSKRAPSGYEVALPSEAMWEIAAADASQKVESLGVFSGRSSTGPLPVGSIGRDAQGFSDLFGNVWEWTSDGFRPYAWIEDASSAYDGLIDVIDAKTVKGGSWANSADQISIASRGPVPAAHASAFLGFRPALIKK
jgi:iron(II)-dependent oxidoreductase